MMTENSKSETPVEARRVIKRYSNRKLYDTEDSRYVTLLQIAELVRAGEDVQIIDNSTKEDKTDITLALIISEELKIKPRGIPLGTLKALIRQRSGKILTQLREGPIRRLIPQEEAPEEGMALQDEPSAGADLTGEPIPDYSTDQDLEESSKLAGHDEQQKGLKGVRATLETWQNAIDERIRAVMPDFSLLKELDRKIVQLDTRLQALEKKLAAGSQTEAPAEEKEDGE